MPAGALIFTDFDHLQSYELDAAAILANAVRTARPDLPILNHPAEACERFDLLNRLYQEGLNPVEVTRLPGPLVPQHYPLFLRAEDGCAGPETDLLETPAELDNALNSFAEAGRPMKRRITVRFTSDRDDQGYFRKYGAFVIGDRIVPIHIMRTKHWVVKHNQRDDDAAFIKEEYAYCEENPHEDWLREVAHKVGIRYGRIDYGFFEGKLAVFEINTNPTFPDVDPDRDQGGREKRKSFVIPQMADALASIDPGPEASSGVIRFNLRNVRGASFVEREEWYEDLSYSLRRKLRWRRRLRNLRRRLTGS
ncbi:hypothetical protein QTO30_15285 [Yoonia sp. GPGPB17]|uniref:hypothetical protein n=1 Tax=Yoonia sp. GPGPB17 TaxID=3026147 RepID=UPI0030C18690